MHCQCKVLHFMAVSEKILIFCLPNKNVPKLVLNEVLCTQPVYTEELYTIWPWTIILSQHPNALTLKTRQMRPSLEHSRVSIQTPIRDNIEKLKREISLHWRFPYIDGNGKHSVSCSEALKQSRCILTSLISSLTANLLPLKLPLQGCGDKTQFCDPFPMFVNLQHPHHRQYEVRVWTR